MIVYNCVKSKRELIVGKNNIYFMVYFLPFLSNDSNKMQILPCLCCRPRKQKNMYIVAVTRKCQNSKPHLSLNCIKTCF